MKPFVLTGASGGGKSTLLAALAARGFQTQPEIGRTLVEEQKTSGGTALPWADAVAFRDILFQRSLEAYDRHRQSDHVVIFDRSFLEAIAYCHVIGEAVPTQMAKDAATRRFRDPIFVCPLWKEIFTQDAERQHDFDFARRDHDANVATYRQYGYRLVDLPKASVPDRVEIVERRIAEAL
ncbi:MAG: AAA family ATPase [Alphaproteobacteria bacterium]|nr:AAA family ATPase [Alphaproteobacteria bacterium]